jgi:hypothetical protein
MACTKETYTATATWTASQLANLFRDAFIDAGLMTAWFDSFANGGIENRILEVTYDGTKAYGKTYYWFMFAASTSTSGNTGFYLNLATGWDATTKVPTGTQYLDFFSTATNTVNNHFEFYKETTPNTIELVRYTSGVDANQSWFVIKSGSSRRAFTIANPANALQPWLDLSKGYYSGFAYCAPQTLSRAAAISWPTGPCLRRELLRGCALIGTTDVSHYVAYPSDERLIRYGAIGHQSNGEATNLNLNAFQSNPVIFLPVGFSATNPAYTSNSNPVFHSLTWNPYITESLPADFGITFHYATNAFSQGDTFVVSAGTEEWEVLDFAANGSAVTGASPLFLARMV